LSSQILLDKAPSLLFNVITLTKEAVMANKAKEAKLVEALEVIAAILECPRDRLGRLDIAATQGEAREALRLLAVRYKATGGMDYMGQCANVARAILREVGAKRQ
jgi:hypothetical protein